MAVPEGSAEPTPDEVVAGFGSGGAGGVRGFHRVPRIRHPVPAVSGGGLGMVLLTVPYLSKVPIRFVLHRARRFRTDGVGSRSVSRRVDPAGAILVGEAGDTDVIVLELTQPPTADVTVRLHATISGHEDRLLFAEEAVRRVRGRPHRDVPRESWSVPIEVKVKAVNDPVIEGTPRRWR